MPRISPYVENWGRVRPSTRALVRPGAIIATEAVREGVGVKMKLASFCQLRSVHSLFFSHNSLLPLEG